MTISLLFNPVIQKVCVYVFMYVFSDNIVTEYQGNMWRSSFWPNKGKITKFCSCCENIENDVDIFRLCLFVDQFVWVCVYVCVYYWMTIKYTNIFHLFWYPSRWYRCNYRTNTCLIIFKQVWVNRDFLCESFVL